MNFSLNLGRLFLEHQAEAGHGISPRTGHLNRMGPVMSFVRMGPFFWAVSTIKPPLNHH